MKIGLDLGHGVGQDRGAVGNITEEEIINSVGRLVIDKLKALGHTVIELRPTSATSVSNSLYQRYNKSDNNNCDWCISIHANAGGGVGTEIFTYGARELTEARNILNNIVELGFRNRGIKDGGNLAMVRRPQAKAMLIEICFVDSSDSDLYKSIGAEKIANAIVSGLTGNTFSTNKYSIGWNEDVVGWFYSYNGNNYYNNCWKEIENKWYYFNQEGYAECNKWIKQNDKWYYLDEHCEMVQAVIPEIVKWKWIEGKCYAFGTNGELYTDCVTYDGYTVNSNGEWVEDIPRK